MKIRKVLSCAILVLLCLTVGINAVTAESEAGEIVEILLSETEEVRDFEEACGEIFEKDEESETETPCLLKMSNGRQKFAKGEKFVLFGILNPVFCDRFSENEINHPLSVSVCARESRSE